MSNKLKDLRDPSDEWIPGAVEFTRWHRLPWTERAAMGTVGMVRIVSSRDAVGFTITGDQQANWIALVRGPSGAIHAVPGCQIASISFDAPLSNGDFAEVP